MEELQTVSQVIALMMGVAWASGINLYAAMLVLGLLGTTGNINLPETLHILEHPLVLSAAGLMFCVEFFADKIPVVDNAWDSVHTFIRIPIGALLAAGAVGEVDPALMLTAGLLGGTLTAGTHAAKAGTRALINTSPEPVSNWVASIAEDIAVVGGLFMALHYPVLFLVFLFCFVIFLIWFLPKVWSLVKRVFFFFKGLFVGNASPPSAPPVQG